MHIPLIVYAGLFPLWLVFYVQGCRHSGRINRDMPLLLMIALTVVGLIMSYLESVYLLNHYGQGVGIKPSSFLYYGAILSVLLSAKVENFYGYKSNIIKRIVEYIGKNSFAIYLIHCYLIAASSSFMTIIHLPWICRWLLILTLTILAVEFIKVILPSRFCYYLGIYD